MSNTRTTPAPTARRRRALVALPLAGLVGVFGSMACSKTDDATPTSTTASSSLDTTTVAPTPTTGSKPTTAPTNASTPTSTAPSTAPAVTSINGPATADCDAATGTVPITVSYQAANAAYVEYLAPGSDRPGADGATGSVMFNYDCTQASQVFKIRAFNEFDGSDSKDPSAYVSVTVPRRIVGDTTTTTAP